MPAIDIRLLIRGVHRINYERDAQLQGFHASGYVVSARDIRLVMEGKPRNLIETVATDIATNILQDYRAVKGLKISVQKPHVALDGVVKSMGASPSSCLQKLQH